MLKDVKTLQEKAVKDLINITNEKNVITFKSPTGSGKTYMMALYMNNLLKKHDDIVFLVSSMSRSELARQNYENFKEYGEKLTYLRPFLITSPAKDKDNKLEVSEVYIPDSDEYNVFILPTQLYIEGGTIVKAFNEWLINITTNGKKIYWIKDEAHTETKNINKQNKYFAKQINISATPKLAKGQKPDIEVTEKEAMDAKIIKSVIVNEDIYYNIDDCKKGLDNALNEFEKIQQEYINKKLGINPCFIIQVSNKGKVEEELKVIQNVLENNHKELNWMYIVTNTKDVLDAGGCATNDEGLKKVNPSKWKDLAKPNVSPIDVIIFKLSIKEGWDIPRACMLFQMRTTQSETLDEQVVGRIRRNPRLRDFERLNLEQQELCLKSFVWGVKEKSDKNVISVLPKTNNLNIKTTKLKDIKDTTFDLEKCLSKVKSISNHDSIFSLYENLQNSSNEINQLYNDYVSTSEDFYKFTENIQAIKTELFKVKKDYEKYMYVPKDDNGNEITHSLNTTYYTEKTIDDKRSNFLKINDWLWKREDNQLEYSFDSYAEEQWAENLVDLTSDIAKQTKNDDENVNMWAKNFLAASEICFEYYTDEIHKSFPDFILQDKKDGIHFFEVKSLSKGNDEIDEEEYEDKIDYLKECYPHCARLTGYSFYIPIYTKDSFTNKFTWKIWYTYREDNGDSFEVKTGEFTYNQFVQHMMNKIK